MMSYGTRIIHDLSTGETTQADVTNVWVRATKRATVALSGVTTAAVGQTVTLQLQLQTAPLTDGTRENITESRQLTVRVDEETESVALDATGAGSVDIECVAAGTYTITVDGYDDAAHAIEVTT